MFRCVRTLTRLLTLRTGCCEFTIFSQVQRVASVLEKAKKRKIQEDSEPDSSDAEEGTEESVEEDDTTTAEMNEDVESECEKFVENTKLYIFFVVK